MSIIKNYWKERFTVGTEHHSDQNNRISEDFLLKLNDIFNNLFLNSLNIIEVGCGTGEFSSKINKKYKKNVLGTDLSDEAINFAIQKYKNLNLNYKTLNLLKDDLSLMKDFDLAVCSNTLEHFKNPYTIIDSVLNHINKFIILVPYNQPCFDGYEDEGGAGHAFTFTENSFKDYNIINWFTFQTSGWQHSSNGEIPLQLAICISK